MILNISEVCNYNKIDGEKLRDALNNWFISLHAICREIPNVQCQVK
jgi:hypothetical protein